MRWVVLACRIALGALFLWAAATKLPDLAGFAQDVANYRLIPAAAIRGPVSRIAFSTKGSYLYVNLIPRSSAWNDWRA